MRILKRNPPGAQQGARARGPGDRSFILLVDEMIQLYVSWREECGSVAVSYENWSDAAAGDRAVAFSAYVAAMDREERAAASYQHVVEQIALI